MIRKYKNQKIFLKKFIAGNVLVWDDNDISEEETAILVLKDVKNKKIKGDDIIFDGSYSLYYQNKITKELRLGWRTDNHTEIVIATNTAIGEFPEKLKREIMLI